MSASTSSVRGSLPILRAPPDAAAPQLRLRCGRLRRGKEWATGLYVRCVHCGACFSVQDLVYKCEKGALPAEVVARFVALHRDEASSAFLQQCVYTSGLTRLMKDVGASFLRRWMSLTDANACVGRGGMFVLSTAQARRLLGERPGGVLLDIGAGNGDVTAQLAPLFDAVIASEASRPMLRRLRSRGFAAFGGDGLLGLERAAAASGITLDRAGTVDCISLLNVLDRCDEPRTLLSSLRDRLKPGVGRLLLAVVLPFRPFVERGNFRMPPREQLHMPPNASWEESVKLLLEKTLLPAGFDLEALSRVPYISGGDVASPIYVLDDAIFVLRRSRRD